MPFNLAVFAIDSADEVINRYSDIENWAIGGHSLGYASPYSNPKDPIAVLGMDADKKLY